MSIFVAVCTVVIVGAAGFVLITFGGSADPLLTAFRSMPDPQKAAWGALAVAFVAMMPAAIWLSDKLVKQRKATKALEMRLDGVRQDVSGRDKAQADAESKVNYLVRTDPEDRIAGLQHRITEADRYAQMQHSRSEVGDLQARVDAIHSQQDILKERLDTALDRRREVETLFTDLDRRQSDIERAIADIEAGYDATDIEVHLRKLAEFIKATHARFDIVEQAKTTLLDQKGAFGALKTRLAPLEDEHSGVRGLIRELHEFAAALSSSIDGLEQSHEGSLRQRLTTFAERKNELAQRVAGLDEQLLSLAGIRKDIYALFANVARALNSLSQIEGDESGGNIDERLGEVSAFINATQLRFDEVERALGVLAQLKEGFGGLQARLVPLEAEDSGVKHVLDNLRDIRDQLARRIDGLERDDECALVERVKKFDDNKKELEDRVASLNEQFSRLASIRKDIGGLLAKLSGTISASMS
jgi:chromosome segregation ATPase